jgi:hypothetical protein
VSSYVNDEFSLSLALESELDDVTPRDGLAALVIARHRKGLRRRFAGVFGLFVVFAGIGVPIGVAGTSGSSESSGSSGSSGSARPGPDGPVALRLGSYTLTLPDRYHLTDAAAAPCAAAAVPRPRLAEGQQAAAATSAVCILMFLTPPFGPGQADPNIPPGAKEVTVGRYRAWLAPRGYAPAGDGAALLIAGGAAPGRDLVIGASGLSQPALVSLVSAGLSAA